MRRMIDRLMHELFPFDEQESDGERLYYRLLELFIVAFTIKFAWEWGAYIPKIEEVVLPLGIAGYVDISFMFEGSRGLWNAGILTVAGIAGFLRIAPGIAYPIALASFHIQYVARYCLGEISHGSNLVGMSMLALAVAAVFFRNPMHRRRFALGFMYFFIGLGYTTAAFSKLIGTGLHWPDGRHLWMWIAERSIDSTSMFGYYDLNMLQEWIVAAAVIGTVSLAFGLIVEFFGFLMWFRRTRYFIIPAIIAMHLGILATMNIFFDAFTFQLLVMGAPWAMVLDRMLDRSASPWTARLRHSQFVTG